MRNRLRSWNVALITLVVTGLTGSLVFVASSDASAKRKKPSKNQSPADFAASYYPPKSFRCSYVEKWDRIEVEDWLCTTEDPHRAILFHDMLVVGPGEGGSWWDDQGWKYLAAPKRFNCALRKGETERITKNYDCAYWDQGKEYTKRPLSNTMYATAEGDNGTKWYLQRLPYPPNPSPLPTP